MNIDDPLPDAVETKFNQIINRMLENHPLLNSENTKSIFHGLMKIGFREGKIFMINEIARKILQEDA